LHFLGVQPYTAHNTHLPCNFTSCVWQFETRQGEDLNVAA
jgi:hypothetical protein